MNVSVVIPVLNAEPWLPALLDSLAAQKPEPPGEIILVDSNSTDRTREIARARGARVVPIADFSHGRSRNLGARTATGDIVVLLTQDARPRDDGWLAALLEPFADPSVAAAYGRQVPRDDASPMERFFLLNRFPDGATEIRRRAGNEPLTFEKVFFSNVAAAVRRERLLDVPFDETLIMSEDQQLSRDLMAAGHAVAYVPGSVVIHSHNYTLKIAFRRYFDSVYSLTVIFPDHDMGESASIGLRYVRKEFLYILRRHPLWFPYYLLYTAAKTVATLAAHRADRMPMWMLKKFSLHAYHWREAGVQSSRVQGSKSEDNHPQL